MTLIDGPGAFSRRLIKLVSTTTWAHQTETAAPAEPLSKELGVRPDILVAARAMVVEERRARGRKPPSGDKVNERGWPQITIYMPEKVFNDWHTWCESRKATSPALLRGILHAYLLGSWEPAWVQSLWRYRGENLPIQIRDQRKKSEWPWRERILLTPGAHGALRFRASCAGSWPAEIVRGLVLEILEGRYLNVIPRDAKSMFDDPERYRR